MQEAEALPANGAGDLQERFLQALALGQLTVAWPAAVHLKQVDAWQDLGDAALQALEVDLAIRWAAPLTPPTYHKGPNQRCTLPRTTSRL